MRVGKLLKFTTTISPLLLKSVIMYKKECLKKTAGFVISLFLFSTIWDILIYLVSPNAIRVINFPVSFFFMNLEISQIPIASLIMLGVFTIFIYGINLKFGNDSPLNQMNWIHWCLIGCIFSLNEFSELFGTFLTDVFILFFITASWVIFIRPLESHN